MRVVNDALTGWGATLRLGFLLVLFAATALVTIFLITRWGPEASTGLTSMAGAGLGAAAVSSRRARQSEAPL